MPGESLAPAQPTDAANGMDENGMENEGEDGLGKLVEAGRRMRDEVVGSVCVRDWELFGGGGKEEDFEGRVLGGG